MTSRSRRRRALFCILRDLAWACALAAALSGCGDGATTRVRVAFRQDGAVVAPDLALPGGVPGISLPARLWMPPDLERPRAVVLALHGYGDSRDAWERVGPRFAAAGIALVAYDQRGFGAAPGRGHWPGIAALLDDATATARFVADRFAGVPLYLMGESMGGAELMVLVAGDRLERAGVHPAGTILLAPAVWGRNQMPAVTVVALDAADLVAPGWTLTGREVPLHIAASDDRAALVRLARDPLTLLASPVSMLSGLVTLMTDAQRAAPHLRGPVLIATGAEDQLVPAHATAAAWAKLPPNVRRAYYAHGYHLLLRDKDRRAVEADLISWIDHPDWPLPSGADALAAGWMAGRSWDDAAPPLPAAALGALTDRDTGDDPR